MSRDYSQSYIQFTTYLRTYSCCRSPPDIYESETPPRHYSLFVCTSSLRTFFGLLWLTYHLCGELTGNATNDIALLAATNSLVRRRHSSTGLKRSCHFDDQSSLLRLSQNTYSILPTAELMGWSKELRPSTHNQTLNRLTHILNREYFRKCRNATEY